MSVGNLIVVSLANLFAVARPPADDVGWKLFDQLSLPGTAEIVEQLRPFLPQQ